MASLCRDCLYWSPAPEDICPACASRRMVRHGELSNLHIGHLDCDAFFAAVEKRDRPELRDKPVIIGGGKRGVVSTCCYVARKFGVRSAMPSYKARELCPGGIFLKPDMEKYQRVGRAIRQMMAETAIRIEPLSIDEAFMEFHPDPADPPARKLADLVLRIRRETGLTVSIGLSGNKFLAKVASDLEKPHGFSIISPTDAPGFLAGRPVRLIWGVGEKFGARLAHDGIYRIGQLQKLSEEELIRRYGSLGARLHALSFGRDHRPVGERAERKSLSGETTFRNDISDPQALEQILIDQAHRVARGLAAKKLAGRTVVLKLKTHDFRSISRHTGLNHPTARAETILAAARPLLRKLCDGTAYRLLGVGLTDLCADKEADPVDLFAWGEAHALTSSDSAISNTHS